MRADKGEAFLQYKRGAYFTFTASTYTGLGISIQIIYIYFT